jgi:myo-inositol-1(or 4)-monophosphatase
MTSISELIAVANEAGDLARKIILSRHVVRIAAKGDRDMVSDLDITVEREIRALVKQRTPDIGFLGEEEGRAGPRSEMTWVLDPIDGTANLIHGLPLCAVSLALVRDDTPVAGVIDLPYLASRYSGFAGGGAYCDGTRLEVARRTDIGDAIIAIGDYAVGVDSGSKNPMRLRLTARLSERAQRVRMFGSAAIDLAWVAAGRLDASIMLSNHPWDTAAGVAIAREAGACVVDADGSEHSLDSTATIAVAPGLLDQVLALVTSANAALAADRAAAPGEFE